jgi:TRAP transporter TAXI family solute receptor
MKAKITFLLLSFSIVSFSSALAQLTILSGPKQGSYYEFVGNIEKALNTESAKLVINTETNGAAFNFEKLADPNSPFKLALTQSDYLYAMQGKDMLNNTEKTKNIKVILPLANEEIHLVTLKGSELKELPDLAGKMVAIGTQSQGTYATSNLIKDRSKVYWNSRPIAYEDALSELGRRKVDAFFIVGSAPMEKLNINPGVMVDELALVSLYDFDDWAKYYQNDTIFSGEYKWLEEDIPTFSVKTVLIVNEAKLTEQDRKDIALMIDGIKTNMEQLKTDGHPKWKEVDLEDWDSSNWPVYK